MTGSLFCGITEFALLTQPANAQPIRADSTLATDSNVSTNGQNFTIDGGTELGQNLFHSFELFSIPARGSATFNNPANIQNIVTRITGDRPSTIDGLIQTNGQANLFLLNRNGILLGPNAQLQIGGSFVASTAERLIFDNDAEFASDKTALNPLLSLSIPAGLQLGASSGQISVTDSGHAVLSAIPLRVDSSHSLNVSPEKTLALIGNDITLEGGVIAAPGGHIEVGSVREGLVTFELQSKTFDYEGVQQFADVTASARSLIDTSSLLFNNLGSPYAASTQGGSIQLQGRNITFSEESGALIQNYGDNVSGNIKVNASQLLKIADGENIIGREPGLATMSFGTGASGRIDVISPRVLIIDDGTISTSTFSGAPSGDLNITAAESVRLETTPQPIPDSGTIDTISFGAGAAGALTLSTRHLSIETGGIFSRTAGTGSGGQLAIEADRIAVNKGGFITAGTSGIGDGGNVAVTADTIEVTGINDHTLLPSIITGGTSASGDAGSVSINTRQLRVRAGGRVDSSTIASGNAGTVTIVADELVSVSGTVPNAVNPSLIASSANIVDASVRAFFARFGPIPPLVPSGNSGDVIITSPQVIVAEGAQITARNDGPGDAGTLAINANSVYLQDRARLSASTQAGSGGNLTLILKDYLLLKGNSNLSAEAGGIGNGGNMTIDAPIIIALENSDIAANAVRGDGGNIAINAQAILGTAFREARSPKSDITASSQFGLSGAVDIVSLNSDLSSGTVALPAEVTDSNEQITAGCSDSPSNRFVASGRGGLPPNPTTTLQDSRLWSDIRASATRSLELIAETNTAPEEKLVEAANWLVNSQGQIALISESTTNKLTKPSTACLKTQRSAAE